MGRAGIRRRKPKQPLPRPVARLVVWGVLLWFGYAVVAGAARIILP